MREIRADYFLASTTVKLVVVLKHAGSGFKQLLRFRCLSLPTNTMYPSWLPKSSALIVTVFVVLVHFSVVTAQPPERPGWDVAWYDEFSGNSLDNVEMDS